mmetsp:Transcript_16122/g.23603  ORF Transcript_16122/g.23603 Transcript_16122/m.23603 type:complete len:581 (+) Transcript_16122:175-1917(+)
MSSSFRRGGKKTTQSRTKVLSSNPNSASTSTSISSPFGSRTSVARFAPRVAAVFERIGTKPWIGGLTLTSSGLRELDAIYSGGQPLGTAILLEEDRWTQDLAMAIVRYWSAEAVAQGQSLALLASAQDVNSIDLSALDDDDDDDDLSICNPEASASTNGNVMGISSNGLHEFISKMIPRDMHLDKARAKSDAAAKQREEIIEASAASAAKSTLDGFGTIGEEGEGEDDDDDDFEEEAAEDRMREDDTGSDANVAGDEGLTNAWQYRLSVQKKRSGTPLLASKSASNNRSTNNGGKGKVYCHSYDLSGKMQDQHEGWIDSNHGASNGISIINCNDNCDSASASQSQDLRSSAFQLFHACRKHIDDQITAKPSTVVRLLIMNAPTQKVAIALPLLLSHIRHHSLPVVLLVTVRPWIHPRSSSSCKSLSSTPSQSHAQALISLRRTCDAVMTFDGFAAMVAPPPSEFSDLAGIMTIRKMALQSLAHFADSTTNRRPPANRYGMKRDRRKMHIRMLHLPPEDFTSSAGGSGSGSGAGSTSTSSTSSDSGNISSTRSSKKGKRTALQPGMSCATTGGSSSSSLDF